MTGTKLLQWKEPGVFNHYRRELEEGFRPFWVSMAPRVVFVLFFILAFAGMGLFQHLATGQWLLIYFIGPPVLGGAVIIALILRRLFGRNRITFSENGIVYRIAQTRRSFDYGAIRSYRFDTLTWRHHKMSVIILKTSAGKTVVMGLPAHITQQEIGQILQKKIRRQG